MKGIPLISVINEEIGGDKFDPSSKAIVVEVTIVGMLISFCDQSYRDRSS